VKAALRFLRQRQVLLALGALVLLAVPLLRHALEASMALHMLVQFPLLAAAGCVLAGALPARCQERLQEWNAYGIAGLTAAALVLSVLMIPRVLDLALVDPRIEAAKALALLACGAALRLSWRRAGLLVQGFFLGNTLPMMAVAGQLYQESPLRLCNAYLLDDQVRLGQALVLLAVGIGCVWIAAVMRAIVRSGEALPSH
jgi:hypothetical protein